MDNNNEYDELLVKYLADDLTVEEKLFVESWMNAGEQNRTYFEELKRTWYLIGIRKTSEEVSVNDEWNHFKETVNAEDIKVIPSYQEDKSSRGEEATVQGRKSIV